MSQKDQVMEYLSTGAEITPLKALHKFNCMRLAARIFDLRREGVDIIERTEWRGRKHWAAYKLGVAYGERI